MSNMLSFPGSGSKYKVEGASNANILSGLWHGLIMPVSFLISLTNKKVSIYETNNNELGYHLGYFMATWGVTGNTIQICFGSSIV